MICPQCRASNSGDSLFCPSCGSRMNVVQAQERIITVGRAADNNIVFTLPTVSSHHAHFRVIGTAITLEDLQSANGTFVNGKKIMLQRVSEGNEIRFGRNAVLRWQQLNDALHVQAKPFPPSGKKESQIVVPTTLQEKPVITVGRTDENDIPIRNVRVSRRHARLVRQTDRWIIEDLGSTNGTFVNGKRVKRAEVTLTDIILIGGLPLSLQNLFTAGQKGETLGDISLEANHLTFRIGGKTIVEDISLPIRPGEFVGLIGPSGAGKTSLMLMLNGVAKPTHGDVYINSISLYQNLDSFKGQIGYVPQDDIIHRELNVEESLRFTARLRFEGKISRTEIHHQVDGIIQSLELEEARKTLIGTADKKGISGGQRKRVNLGQELMTEPALLFLDEPTSGLDPKTDIEVMHMLKQIAERGKIVVLTTHNITVENFEILSHVIVLSKGGKLAYFGPANQAAGYFGVEKPYEIFDALKREGADYWRNAYRDSPFFSKYIEGRREVATDPSRSGNAVERPRRSADLRQFFTLAQRYLLIKIRDKISTLILLLQAPIIAFLIALVFSKPEEKTPALFVLIIAAIWLGCSNAAREIVTERSIFKRERMVNLKIPSYVFSKLCILSVLCVTQCSILSGIVIPSLGLHIAFLTLTGLLLLTSLSALAIGLFLSSVVKTNESSMALTPIVLIPQVILGGLISRFMDMNDFVKGLAGLMLSRWSFEAVMIGEYHGKMEPIITAIGFDPENIPFDVGMLIFFGSVFVTLTSLVLWKKGEKMG